MAYPGALYIVSAPSGAGKTSLVNALVHEIPHMKISISHTTRPVRPGEKAGEDYYFVSHAEFQDMIDKNLFLEYAKVFGQFYGTSRVWVEEQRAAGIDILLEIDWQGAQQIRKQFSESISIFILPPSIDELRARLLKRHQDHPEVIENRLKEAVLEMSKYTEYDYLICNDLFEDALRDLKTIVRATRLRLATQQLYQADRIKKLIS
jgi:guanylate kinase